MVSPKVYIYHLIIGLILATGATSRSIGVGLLSVLYFWVFIQVIRSNSVQKSLKYIFFVSGLEIFTKVSHTYITWEFTKQFIILLLITIIVKFLSNPIKKNLSFSIYILLLTPGIFLIPLQDFKSGLSYFYPYLILFLGFPLFQKLTFSKPIVAFFLEWMMLGFLYSVIYLILFGANIDNIDYGRQTVNVAVGFSGNQFTNAIAAAIVIVFVIFYFDYPTKNRFVLLLLFVFLLFRGFSTISRGGIFSALGAILFMVCHSFFQKKQRGKFRYLIFGGLITMGLYQYINLKTSDSLRLRYTGRSEIMNTKLSDYSTGRGDISKGDWITFLENPIFGVGLSQSGVHNKIVGMDSHNEYMRHLSEHGLLGMIALTILLGTIFKHSLDWIDKAEFIGFAVLFLLYIYQGSTRVTPEFLLLLLIFIKRNKNKQLSRNVI